MITQKRFAFFLRNFLHTQTLSCYCTFPPVFSFKPSPQLNMASFSVQSAIEGLSNEHHSMLFDLGSLTINRKSAHFNYRAQVNDNPRPCPNDMSCLWSHFKNCWAKVNNDLYQSVLEYTTDKSETPFSQWIRTAMSPLAPSKLTAPNPLALAFFIKRKARSTFPIQRQRVNTPPTHALDVD